MAETFGIIVSAVVAVFLGAGIFFKPSLVISWQQRFYEKINWRMEPISMPKEIKNTRLMGLFLILFTLGSLVYVWLKP